MTRLPGTSRFSGCVSGMVPGDHGPGNESDCDCTMQALHFVTFHQRKGAQELPEECMRFAASGHP